MKKALVVLSGGQDSTTCLAMCVALMQKGSIESIAAITFDYGQHHSVELQAARNVAALCGISEHEFVRVGPILSGRSPLIRAGEELERYDDFDSMNDIIGDRVEKTFVPMRNALFLTLAANRAVCMGADMLVTGVCEADGANYPDCRREFIQAQQEAINTALGFNPQDEGYLKIWAPLIGITKATSVDMMADLGVNAYALLAFSHTAYDGQYPPVGKDHASILRAEGFRQAGKPDPLVLRAVSEDLMPLPLTDNYRQQALFEFGRAPGSLIGAIVAHKERLAAVARRVHNQAVATARAEKEMRR